MTRTLLYAGLLSSLAAVAGCPPPMHPPTPVQPKLHTCAQTDRGYWLYVPSYYDEDPSRTWPLVVSLHGTYGWDGAHAQAVEWKWVAEQKGFLVATPRLKSVQGILPRVPSLWLQNLAEDEEHILAVIEEVCREWRVDPKVVMLTGFSAGGYPLYYTGLRNADRFHMLVARACNSDLRIFEGLQLTDRARKMPIVVYWGKDDLGTIIKESWQAFRWLREHGCKGATVKKVQGGHLRRPELAYGHWLEHLPAAYRPGAP